MFPMKKLARNRLMCFSIPQKTIAEITYLTRPLWLIVKKVHLNMFFKISTKLSRDQWVYFAGTVCVPLYTCTRGTDLFGRLLLSGGSCVKCAVTRRSVTPCWRRSARHSITYRNFARNTSPSPLRPTLSMKPVNTSSQNRSAPVQGSAGTSHRSASPRPTTLEEDQDFYVDFS